MEAGGAPSDVQTLAVTAGDVVAAVEARRQRGKRVVLRATPPFSGRMRARLHVPDEEADAGAPSTLTVDPERLLGAEAPDYPTPAETEDDLRSDPEETYTVDRHHDRHEAAIAAWRSEVRDHFVDEVTVETPVGERTVAIVVLG